MTDRVRPYDSFMALVNKKTLAKVKALAEKNKDKIADSVHKATDAIDKKTGGKHRDKLKKVDDAAAKFANGDEAAGPGDAAPGDRPDTAGIAADDTPS